MEKNAINCLPFDLLSLPKLRVIKLFGNPLSPPFDVILASKKTNMWEEVRCILLQQRDQGAVVMEIEAVVSRIQQIVANGGS